MYYIQRNGQTNSDINLYVKERPRIPSPEYKYDKQEIPGRDGELYTEYETVEDITIPVILTFTVILVSGKICSAKQKDGFYQK